MNTLSSLEWSLQVGLAAAALLVAARSAWLSLRAPSRHTGEIVWTAVAVTMLLAVAFAVGRGASHGG